MHTLKKYGRFPFHRTVPLDTRDSMQCTDSRQCTNPQSMISSLVMGHTGINLVDPESSISTFNPNYRKDVVVKGVNCAYVDTGEAGDMPPVVFLHGNPTSSFVWRNVIPSVMPTARCLAPDLLGMGNSGNSDGGTYVYEEHQAFIDAWFDAVLPKGPVTLVVQEWGSVIGFAWAHRHQKRVAGLVYMEAMMNPFSEWENWPQGTRDLYIKMRTEPPDDTAQVTEDLIKNSTTRTLHPREMEKYTSPFVESSEVVIAFGQALPIVNVPDNCPGSPQLVLNQMMIQSAWMKVILHSSSFGPPIIFQTNSH